MQERILSPRVLYLGSGQVCWQCNKTTACETFPTKITQSITPKLRPEWWTVSKTTGGSRNRYRDDIEAITDNWLSVVAIYTICEITYEKDRLVALSGLARLISQQTRDGYLAGLWKSRLFQQLTWYTA